MATSSSSSLSSLASSRPNKRVICNQLNGHCPNRILVASNDLKIYEYQSGSPFQPIFTLPEHQFNNQKCIDFITDPSSHSDYLAIGFGIGKISVVRLSCSPLASTTTQTGERSIYFSQIITELISKHNRACTALSFSPQGSSILASGFDKLRNEPSILIWDMESQMALRAVSPSKSDWAPMTLENQDLASVASKWSLEKSNSFSRDTNLAQKGSVEFRTVEYSTSSPLHPLPIPKPVFTPFINNTANSSSLVYPYLSSGPPEPVSSLAWLSPNQLVAGMSGKWLRLFDVRDNLAASHQWSTRTVYGIAVDPFSTHRFATYSDVHEGHPAVKFWDTRKPSEVCMQLDTSAHQLCFSKYQEHTFYVAHTNVMEYLVSGYEPLYLRKSHDTIYAFDELQPHTLAALVNPTPQLDTLTLITLLAPPAIALHPHGSLLTSVKYELQVIPSESDIALEMKERAEWGYSMEILKNISLFEEKDPTLFALWSWMKCIDELSISGRVQLGGLDFSYQGLHRVLQGLTENASVSSQDNLSIVYSSPQRKLALSICGWLGPKELEVELIQLESHGFHEKAALLSFLHSDLSRCIRSLLESKDTQLQLMSGTFAGFSPLHANPSWIQLCEKLSKEASSSELQAMLTFFATSDWKQVIQSNISMREKLLIALRFLEDTDLALFVESAGEQMVRNGSLEGLLFTGITPEAVNLLRVYVDQTGDIQTAALILAFVVPHRFRDPKVDEWIESYRSFLDRLQLFPLRAIFDIQHNKYAGGELSIPPQVQVSCYYCNQSISNGISSSNSKDRSSSNLSKMKQAACSNCYKPLPRCALCLLPLGMPPEPSSGKKNLQTQVPLKFSHWITWCQACHHGGHAGHLIEWFCKHDTCPIADCNCQCALL